MKRKTLCIVIALMVLSISAIVGAGQRILDVGRFSSTVNGVPVEVILARQFGESSERIKTMRARDLRRNWAEHDGRFVKFTGRVENVSSSIFSGSARVGSARVGSDSDRILTLEGTPTIEVYLLDAPRLPEIYHEGDEYAFTGFLIRYEGHAENQKSGTAKMRVYAFEIWHLGEAD